MKIRALSSVLAIVAITLGCGDDAGTGATSGTGGSGTGGATSAGGGAVGGAGVGGAGVGGQVAVVIPDPGAGMNGEWIDTEPNDTPAQAVPMGTLTGPMWAGFAQPYTAINPEDDVDYFVFKTGTDLVNVNMTLCWSFTGNLLDMNLYEVTNQTQGALVKAATSTASGCETLVDFNQGPNDLTPNTTYLLEVLGAPGLALGGDAGLYAA